MLATEIDIVFLHPGAKLPCYKTRYAAGMDICACIEGTMQIDPGQRALINTGIAVAIPAGFEAQIRPRSGLALQHGIALVNSPGTIDADYRGEIKIILINHGGEPFDVHNGDRIAQMVVAPVCRVEWHRADALETTARNEGGFGHTGKNG